MTMYRILCEDEAERYARTAIGDWPGVTNVDFLLAKAMQACRCCANPQRVREAIEHLLDEVNP